ncbi:hypothetical protein HNR65_003403 [Desulfosalsimonas propionicica]|uniref:Uncharacterized protein n=1 Tax=Desulfosalsimonas propionicica TaxID=332175 RepID=A0A7W0CC57_9BACT|nr:DUF99 family protein [Desulfosalsimonas propionicica]MBA2883046.1 hypothetical protein [Desulfosalsimonas propionicica]
MATNRLSNVAGFDDAPFSRTHAGSVPVVATVYADLRFDGVLTGKIEKDGFDAAEKIAAMVSQSRFARHVRLILLQGIALGGFNVVDVFGLHDRLGLPVVAVARKQPDMTAIKNALLSHIARGREKWAIIEKLGPMEPLENVYVQRVGLSSAEAAAVLRRFCIHGRIPEPIRTAHLIATAMACGQSRGHP